MNKNFSDNTDYISEIVWKNIQGLERIVKEQKLLKYQ